MKVIVILVILYNGYTATNTVLVDRFLGTSSVKTEFLMHYKSCEALAQQAKQHKDVHDAFCLGHTQPKE